MSPYYLYEQRRMANTCSKLSGLPGSAARRYVITDPEGRTYTDLNRVGGNGFLAA